MNSQRENGDKKLWCELCQKEFSCVSTKNRHLKNFHNKTPENSRHQHIRCPLCSKEEREPFGSYESLTKHLEQFHDVSINESTLYFRNLVEFETWRRLENREVDYMCNQRNKDSNGEEHIYYYCNRSNIKGFVSSCKKRSMKYGGSILISGACPSKIIVKVCKDGLVMVKYVETHVGHNDELRTKRLSKVQEEHIVGQLAAGVTKDKVLEDARIITNGKLERLNLITRGNLAYFTRKYNINKRDTDDMVATGLKIEERNKEGKDELDLLEELVNERANANSYQQKKNAEVHKKAESEMEDSLNSPEDVDVDALHIDESITSQSNYHGELSHCIEEKKVGRTFNQSFEEERKILLAEINDFAITSTLDKESFEEFRDQFRKFKNKWQQRNANTCRKRKIKK